MCYFLDCYKLSLIHHLATNGAAKNFVQIFKGKVDKIVRGRGGGSR